MITATGWTVAQLSATPWPDVLDLLDYWNQSPPVHVLVRAYMGGGKDSKGAEPTTEAELMAGIAGF